MTSDYQAPEEDNGSHLRGLAGIAVLAFQNMRASGEFAMDSCMAAALINTLDGLLGEIDDLRAQLAVAKGDDPRP